MRQPKTTAATDTSRDLPEDLMDPEMAYYDTLWPDRVAREDEIRRAYAMNLALEAAPYDKAVALAGDITAFLKHGPRGGNVVEVHTRPTEPPSC